MAVTKKQWMVLIGAILVVTAGVIVGIIFLARDVTNEQTVEQRVHDILDQNPLIDG